MYLIDWKKNGIQPKYKLYIPDTFKENVEGTGALGTNGFSQPQEDHLWKQLRNNILNQLYNINVRVMVEHISVMTSSISDISKLKRNKATLTNDFSNRRLELRCYRHETVISLKTGALIYFHLIWKNPCCHALIWSKKRHSCHNYNILIVEETKYAYILLFTRWLPSCP